MGGWLTSIHIVVQMFYLALDFISLNTACQSFYQLRTSHVSAWQPYFKIRLTLTYTNDCLYDRVEISIFFNFSMFDIFEWEMKTCMFSNKTIENIQHFCQKDKDIGEVFTSMQYIETWFHDHSSIKLAPYGYAIFFPQSSFLQTH